MITRNAFIDRVGTIESDGTHCQSVFFEFLYTYGRINVEDVLRLDSYVIA
jgi:hypothetical protein